MKLPITNFVEAFSGWLIFLLLAITSYLPYLFRTQTKSRSPYLQRIRSHFWIGYAIVLLCGLHGYTAMRILHKGHANIAGLWLATVAFFLLLAQLITGIQLKQPILMRRKVLRTFHFGMMILIVLLAAAHILLNG